jgi:hypothetical protein
MTRQCSLLALAFLLLASACGDDRAQTGDSCTKNEDCADSRCIIGGSFPDGVCTPECDTNADCPSGFSCISRSSGMCLRDCTSTTQCEQERGSSWQCRDESLQQGGGNTMVCIGD